MNMKIENIQPLRIAYIRQIGPYGTGNVLVMEKIKSWAKSKHLFHEQSTILGIAYDNPSTAWSEVFPELLKRGCQFDESRPILERYQEEMIKENFCEMCLPIQ